MTLRGAFAAVVLAVFALPALAQRPAATPTPAASEEGKPADKEKDKKAGDGVRGVRRGKGGRQGQGVAV